MSVEAIEEYLAIAKHCIIDPLGNYGGYAKNTLRGARFIVPDLTESSILKTGIVIFLRTKLSSCLERNSPTIP